LFSLFNILMFESTTVFQRLKTLNTLNGMSTKPYMIQVWREMQWQTISTEQLLPGDLIWVKRSHAPTDAKAEAAAAAKAATGASPGARPKKPATSSTPTDVVPCDCLLLKGSAVVNEATLTGESVPQMKDAIAAKQTDTRPLDFDGQDRVHTLFSGTSLVSTISGAGAGVVEQETFGPLAGIPLPEENGCLCYVLRTGFNSSQGELIQMIEYSTQKVSADSKETLMALGILLVFALVAAAYVFHKGMIKGDRTTHQLLLKCVIIITSVVPQQLPMQMALAVNTALMALMKKGVFCTEPYRVQFAGKVAHCLFDKTGTLTTDQLVPAGVLCADKTDATKKLIAEANAKHVDPALQEVINATTDAGMVMGACHALVYVEGPGLVGDPIELAGLAGVGWAYDAAKETAVPGDLRVISKAVVTLKAQLAEGQRRISAAGQPSAAAAAGQTQPTPAGAPSHEAVAEMKKNLATLEGKAAEVAAANAKSTVKSVHIVHRHHFSSKLQRMSVVCDVAGQNGGPSGACCLVKGSPEAVGALLAPGAKPEWYDTAYRLMAEKGKRVLALAFKWSDKDGSAAVIGKKDRDWVESGLTFAGFIAFECKNRADSGMVLKALKQSSHSVAMVTGDAPLTALHVAVTLGICDSDRTALTLTYVKTPSGPKCKWVGAVGERRNSVSEPFASPGVEELGKIYELVTTEEALLMAVEESKGEVWKEVHCIHVFARMSPQGKAMIIRMIQEHRGEQVLMCGDGGNDVGALKQADCGIALLGGYGNSNTEDGADVKGDEGGAAAEGSNSGAVQNAEEQLNQKSKDAQKKMAEVRKVMNKELVAVRSELAAKQSKWLQEYVDAGEGYFSAIKKCTGRMQTELKAEQMKIQKKHGNAFAPKKDEVTNALGDMAENDMLQIVRPGDASVAAPFTSKVPSIRSVVDLIRQGRCTLLSALQQQQIMMLQSIVSAYVLSALSLEGARSSERQMMASSWLILTASLAFSYSTPIEQMSPERPLKSLFHPAIFISMIGQAAIHLGCMIYAVNLATETMGPAALKAVVEFNKKVYAGEDVSETPEGEEEDPWAEMMTMWSKPFMPNLMNTVVFLVETAQIMAILLVNYKGRPWMKGIVENHALCLSLFITIAGLFVLAWGISPELNTLIHLEEFPDDEFRWKVVTLVGISLVGTFVWDRVITMIFAPTIFKAMFAEAAKTTIADLVPLFTTMFKVIAGVAIFASGNILVWGAVAWWWWKRRQAAQ